MRRTHERIKRSNWGDREGYQPHECHSMPFERVQVY